MKRVIYRIMCFDGRWHIGGPRIVKADRWHATKTAAVGLASALCRWRWRIGGQLSQLVIHKRDGTIEEERTYGRDPRRFKG